MTAIPELWRLREDGKFKIIPETLFKKRGRVSSMYFKLSTPTALAVGGRVKFQLSFLHSPSSEKVCDVAEAPASLPSLPRDWLWLPASPSRGSEKEYFPGRLG